MVRISSLGGLVLLFYCIAIPAQAAAPKVFVDPGAANRIVVERDGKETRVPEDGFGAQPVKNSKLLYTAFGDDDAQKYGVVPGIYIFDGNGKPAASAPLENADMSGEAAMSPGGTVLAVDLGGSLVRDWAFFSFPSMKRLDKEGVGYYAAEGKPTLVWLSDTDMLFNTMQVDDPGRACGYDPCGPVSIARHDLDTGRTTPVLQGTALCDYTLVSFAGGMVTAEKLCLKNAKDWENYPENALREKMTVKLP